MKRVWSAAFALMLVLMMAGPAFSAVQPIVVGVDVTGNQEVISDHILGVIGTKVGDQFNPEQVQQDIDTIYGLGFFSFVDVNVVEQFGGVFVEYKVQENPIVRDVNFTGNTVFTADQLMEVVFTRPGSVFNRAFFRHDLQRIREKYEKAGYAFVQVQDVGIQDGVIDVRILEPKVGEIIIQGNKKTKSYVIEREFNLKTGDLLNTTILRHSLKKINQLGFLEDVRVGFEPAPDPEIVNIVLTVEEGKSSRISLTVGHGSESGWSGGAAWEELNYRGLGHIIGIGFEMGDREQYWLQYRSPYMDEDTYGWEAGLYSYEWADLVDYTDNVLNVTYDQDKRGIYAGIGKKFPHNPTLSWFLKGDYHEVEIYNVRKEEGKDFPPKKGLSGTNYSVTGTLTRNLLDPYLSYPKGQVQSLNVEYGIFESSDPGIEDMNYTKYWLEWRYYLPLFAFFQDLLDREIGTEDDPVIFASRIRVGYSSGELPYAEQFFVGGSRTLRGYRDDYFKGSEMALANFELRVPIQDAISVVAFYDIGMASDESAFSDLKSGYGIGVRVKTPMGNLRIDFAYGEDENRTHFGFGEMF